MNVSSQLVCDLPFMPMDPVVQASCLTVEKVNPGGVIAAMQLGQPVTLAAGPEKSEYIFPILNSVSIYFMIYHDILIYIS